MKKKDILDKINKFLNELYPHCSGVMLFGSASFSTDNHTDIDLLVVDEKFSYVSKTSIQFQNQLYSVIKIPAHDIFNILAKDFNKGIYKEIFETGFILKDEIKILQIVKQYICKDYPDNKDVIRYKISNRIFKINECIDSLKNNLPLLEEYLGVANCINFIIDFILLKDGKYNFLTSKHKSRYLHQYHLEYAIKINKIIKESRNKKEKLLGLENLRNILDIPAIHEYNNDYLIDNLGDLSTLVFYIPEIECDELLQNVPLDNLAYYTFFIDTNNIEDRGFYLIVDSKYSNDIKILGDKLRGLLVGKKVFFPYNFSFNHQIKFGSNFSKCQKFFISIQPIIKGIRYDKSESLKFIKYLIKNISLTLEEIAIYYFYKTVNNDHSRTIDEIAKKEKEFIMRLKKTRKLSFENTENQYNIDFNFLQNQMPKYIRLQVFDYVLSMFFLKDSEKVHIIELIRNTNIRYV